MAPSARMAPVWRGLRAAGMALAALAVALIVIGQLMFLARTVQSGSWLGNASAAPRTGNLSRRLDTVLSNALGPSDRGVRRFHASLRPDPAHRHQWQVHVLWAINRDLSAGTVGNGAEADVYLMLRDIYTARLPVSSVRLDGTYALPGRREQVVMRLAMLPSVADTINQTGWDNLDPQTLWPLVERTYVAPQFQPLSGE